MIRFCQQITGSILKWNLKKWLQFANFQPPLILLRPLYLVLKRLIHIFSLCFLYCGFWLNIFSITVTVMSLKLCPILLMCSPVALLVTFDVTYPLCSKNRSFKVLSVSPMYCWVHFLHPIKYTTFLEVQLTLVLISTFRLFDVDFTVFPSFMNGQTPNK